MLKHALTIVGYAVVTFAVQGASHFAINQAHYSAVPFNAEEPVLWMGIAAMLVQGAILSAIYTASSFRSRGLMGALTAAWLLGGFLVSYIAVVEPSKYAVPNIAAWVFVEGAVGLVQFTLIGLALWLAHRVGSGAAALAPSRG